MNAKTRNKSNRLLFLDGGSLLAVLEGSEMKRQFDEARRDEAARRRAWQELARMAGVVTCPCGCGAEGLCDEQAERVRVANQELPF